MSRHLVRSFLLASALSSFVNAGPCRPHPTSGLSLSGSLTQTVSSSVVPSSSVVLIGTETVSQSDAVSQDAATGTGTSIVPTDSTLTLSDMISISTSTHGDAGVSTDLYPSLPSDSTFTISSTTYGAGTLSTAVSMSSATDILSTVGTETTISHATDTTAVTASETNSSSAIPTGTTATSGEIGIASTTETEPTLAASMHTISTGGETQSSHGVLADTTATSSGTDISSAIGTDTTSSVTADRTFTTSGTESPLAPLTETIVTFSETYTTATTTGDASLATTSGTSTDTIVTSTESETTTAASGDLGTTGTDYSGSTSETVSTDSTITSSETSATTETGASSVTTEATSTDTTVTSKEMDTTTTTSGDLATETDSFTSSTDNISTDTTATTATTSGDSTTGTESTSTTEATSSDTTVTTKETDTTAMTPDENTPTTVTDPVTSTTETASTDTTVTTTGTDTSAITTSTEPTSMTDTFTSTTEATSDATLSSSETGTLTAITSGDLTTGTDSFTSTTETGSTDSTTTDTATTETTATSGETTTATSGALTTTESTTFSSTTEATSTAPGTSTAALPACTPGHLISPPPQALECGKKGFVLDDANEIFWDQDELTVNIETCYNACKKTRECGSIIFEEGVICDLYKGKPGETDGADTGFKWYDMGCFCEEAPTEPEPVCVDDSPTEKVCGMQGWAGNECLHWLYSFKATSFTACQEACKTNNCDSFSVNGDNGLCEVYQGRVGGTDDYKSPWKWYDKACFDDTTPTEPETKCVNNVLQPSPKDSVCGKTGNPTGQGLEEIGSATATSLQGCRDACNKKAGCDSFQLEEGFNCYLFKGKVGGTDARTTSEVWYDMSCFCGLEAQPTNPDDEEYVCVDEVHKTQVCGLEGRPMYECIEDISENMSDPALIKSLDACRARCKSVGCDSLAYKKDEACAFFKGRIGGVEARNEFPGYKLYDMSCFTEEPTKDVCIGKPLNPLPANTVCGKPGDVNNNLLSNKHIKTDMTLAECYQACKAASDCDVFNFNNQRCELYKTKSSFSSASVVFSGSTIQWWQPSCFCDDTKTDTNDPEPVCVNNMLSPPPKNSNCGAKGSILTQGLSLEILDTGDDSSLKACSDSCKTFGGCKSFSFLKENICIFFGASAGPTDGSETEHAYYDMSCFCDGIKTTEPAPTCQNNMLAPAPQGLVCGKTGIPIGNSNADKVGQGTANTPVACYQLCKNTAKCQTMYFHKDTGDCQLYSGAVKDTNPATTSFVWYDKGCFCDSNHVIGD